MKTHKNIYYKIYRWQNLLLAFSKARKGKTKKDYVKKFEENLIVNLQQLQFELMIQKYKPKPQKTFILRDPKTRKISKSDFRDRIIHHALCNVIEPIFQKSFIHDSCTNQKGKGTLFAIKRLDKFLKKVTRNGKTRGWFCNNQIKGYCLKADIKHYFEEVSHEILLNIIKRKIRDKNTIQLIAIILKNHKNKNKGIPLGNLTSQFFANIYLNELDYYIKHKLKIKFYIRYVDDFIILNSEKRKLSPLKTRVKQFVKDKLKLKLHSQKSRITRLSSGIDFLGFRNYYYFKFPRKRCLKKMQNIEAEYSKGKISKNKFNQIYQGWLAHIKQTNHIPKTNIQYF